MACRSLLNRILQAAEDDRRIAANPVRKVPAPKRPVDAAARLGRAKRRAYTPEEFGYLIAHIGPFYRDHFLTLVGTGMRPRGAARAARRPCRPHRPACWCARGPLRGRLPRPRDRRADGPRRRAPPAANSSSGAAWSVFATGGRLRDGGAWWTRSSSGWRSPSRSLRRSADGRTWQDEPLPRWASRSEVGLLRETPLTLPKWSFPGGRGALLTAAGQRFLPWCCPRWPQARPVPPAAPRTCPASAGGRP